MTHSSFLSFGRLSKGSGHLLVAARHNKRTIQAEKGAGSHIDASRSRLNFSLRGESTPEAINDVARRKMDAAGIIKLRKDAIRAIEILFSLPFKSTIDPRDYFEHCKRWAGDRFGQENILSSDVHLDESCPHCHVLILPLRDGRMVGSAMIGGRAQLIETRKHFNDNVATLYGLRLEPRLRGASKEALAEAVTKRLTGTSDPVTHSSLWQVVRDAIGRDPAPFALALNIPLPTEQPKTKSVAAIFTGTGKRTSEDKNTIGFARPQKAKPMLCRFPSPAAPCPSASIESIRVRDTEFSAEQFDPETREFVTASGRSRNSGNRATLLTIDAPAQHETA